MNERDRKDLRELMQAVFYVVCVIIVLVGCFGYMMTVVEVWTTSSLEKPVIAIGVVVSFLTLVNTVVTLLERMLR